MASSRPASGSRRAHPLPSSRRLQVSVSPRAKSHSQSRNQLKRISQGASIMPTPQTPIHFRLRRDDSLKTRSRTADESSVHHTVNYSTEDFVERTFELTGGLGVKA